MVDDLDKDLHQNIASDREEVYLLDNAPTLDDVLHSDASPFLSLCAHG
jgi:hypothetical protein